MNAVAHLGEIVSPERDETSQLRFYDLHMIHNWLHTIDYYCYLCGTETFCKERVMRQSI